MIKDVHFEISFFCPKCGAWAWIDSEAERGLVCSDCGADMDVTISIKAKEDDQDES